MSIEERKEKIRKNAEKLMQMTYMQLLVSKAFQDGMIAGQRIESERQKEK